MFRDRARKKKERGQYPAILIEKAWSIEDLLFGFQGNLSRETQWLVTSGQDSSILPALVANHSMQFGSSCPLTELVAAIIIIKMGTGKFNSEK